MSHVLSCEFITWLCSPKYDLCGWQPIMCTKERKKTVSFLSRFWRLCWSITLSIWCGVIEPMRWPCAEWLDLNTQETTSSVLPSPNVLVCSDFPLQRFMIPFPLNLFTQPTRPKREKKTRRGWLPNSRTERCGSWLWPEGFQPVPKTGMKWLCCQWEWESARDITPGQVLQVATQARRSHLSTHR